MNGEGRRKISPTASDADELCRRALESLSLAIELFNRPSETARPEAVLILLHHGYEMILKSLIIDKTGTVIDEQRGYSYQFDTCLRLSAEQLGFIDADQRRFLSMLDNLRDSAMHYYQIISEDILYIFAQGAVTLFDKLIRRRTGKCLLDYLPDRVLPISSHPPQSLQFVIDQEFENLRLLLKRPDVSKHQALAMLRPLMAFKVGGENEHRRMTSDELEIAVENLKSAENWRVVFPDLAQLKFVNEGEGIAVQFKVVKDGASAMPVRILKPDDPIPEEGVIVHREINIFDKFNLGLVQLAEKLGISTARTQALILEFRVRDDTEMYRMVTIGSQQMKRYSKKALDLLRSKLDVVEDAWRKHRLTLTRRRRMPAVAGP